MRGSAELKKFRKLMAVMTALIMSCASLSVVGVSADSNELLEMKTGILGGVSENYDIDQNNEMNVFDTVMLKQQYLENSDTDEICPIDNMSHSFPTKGDAEVLVFSVDFQDVKYSSTEGNILSADEIQNTVFGAGDTGSNLYPMESISAFYNRASYGKFNLTGDVLPYTANGNRADYEDDYEKLVNEIFTYYDEQIDFTKYDTDSNGIIDAVAISIPTDNTDDDLKWWGKQCTWTSPQTTYDGVTLGAYIINDAQPVDYQMDYYVRVLCHELGHAMGLPDYYKYESSDSDTEGFHGYAGDEPMDDMAGDFCAFSKLMYGWISPKNVQVADPRKNGTYTIKPIEFNESMLIVPIGELNENYFSEYFVIEYQSRAIGSNSANPQDNGGIRIFHVDAETVQSYYDQDKLTFKYENYSEYYTETRRLLQLVGDKGSGSLYYHTGDTITDGTEHFYAYDSDNKETIDTGFSIKIGDLTDDGYTIEIIPD